MKKIWLNSYINNNNKETNRENSKHKNKQTNKMKSKFKLKECNNMIMVFDVETNKLLPKKNESNNISNMPNILQMSYAIYNNKENKCEKLFNSYIKIDDSIEISEFITGLTGITREKCNNGRNIKDCLLEFYNDFIKCDIIVAHNYEFDMKVIQTEIERNIDYLKPLAINIGLIFDPMQMLLRGIRYYCTMKENINFCNLYITYNKKDASGNIKQDKYKKFPTLSELYKKIFHYDPPDGLHNSIIDVLVCLRCFMKLKICKPITDRQFEILIEKYK